MTEQRIRPATPADLGQVYDIWYEAEVAEQANAPPRGEVPAIFWHELESGEMFVAEQDGQILAYAALVTRSAISYLAEFYVRKGCQSAGIGQRLLQHTLPTDGRTSCTLSSDDHRALALYARSGLRPHWPNFLLEAQTAHLGNLPDFDVGVLRGQADDPDLVRWDTACSGRHRPADHTYWTEQAEASPLWLQRRGQTVGYGYVQRRSHEALWHPEALWLGPIGVMHPGDALACACAIVDRAAQVAPTLLLGVPGAHPSLSALLAAGFRITYVETFMSTGAEPFTDPVCYIPSSSTLF
jgi:GNAT superfamily N-acetyltransferase